MTLLQVPEITVRVMSLNMQYGAGQESREDDRFLTPIPPKELDYNLDAIVSLIYNINPDIVSLQEVDSGSSRTGYMKQHLEIAQRLAKKQQQEPYNAEFGSCIHLHWNLIWETLRYFSKKSKRPFQKFGILTDNLPDGPIDLHFGNAILSRYTLTENKHDFFIPPYWEPHMNFNIIRRKDERKSWLVCRVNYCPEIAEKVPLFIYNTHLENKDEKNRKLQSKLLYHKLSKRSNAHKILTMDGNAEPLGADYDLESGLKDESLERLLRHPEMKYFEGICPPKGEREIDPLSYATYPSNYPSQILDTILASEYLQITNYLVHPTRVSDHLAVVADIKIKSDLVQENILTQMVNPLVETP